MRLITVDLNDDPCMRLEGLAATASNK